jgi:hypothetical protein
MAGVRIVRVLSRAARKIQMSMNINCTCQLAFGGLYDVRRRIACDTAIQIFGDIDQTLVALPQNRSVDDHAADVPDGPLYFNRGITRLHGPLLDEASEIYAVHGHALVHHEYYEDLDSRSGFGMCLSRHGSDLVRTTLSHSAFCVGDDIPPSRKRVSRGGKYRSG